MKYQSQLIQVMQEGGKLLYDLPPGTIVCGKEVAGFLPCLLPVQPVAPPAPEPPTVGQRISRADALRIAKDICIKAEQERQAQEDPEAGQPDASPAQVEAMLREEELDLIRYPFPGSHLERNQQVERVFDRVVSRLASLWPKAGQVPSVPFTELELRDKLFGTPAANVDELARLTYPWILARMGQPVQGDQPDYRQALEDDAADLWRVTNAIKKEIESRQWITEGRGSYAYDDDRYRDETKQAFDAILKLIEQVQDPAQKRFHAAMKSQPLPVTAEEPGMLAEAERGATAVELKMADVISRVIYGPTASRQRRAIEAAQASLREFPAPQPVTSEELADFMDEQGWWTEYPDLRRTAAEAIVQAFPALCQASPVTSERLADFLREGVKKQRWPDWQAYAEDILAFLSLGQGRRLTREPIVKRMEVEE